MDKFEIEYDFTDLATVEIDGETAASAIKEMVEFWMGWEDAVENNDGDYTTTWLKNLAMFILRNGHPPEDEEGWVPLDGTRGIRIKSWEAWRPDNDGIDIFKNR